MGPREAVTACFQDYFKFSGRARRPEFWWFFLFDNVGFHLLAAIDRVVFGTGMLLGLSGLFGLFTFFPFLAVSWRRLHDTDRPGWYALVPLVSLFVLAPLAAAFGPDLRWKVEMLAIGVSLLLWLVLLVWLAMPTQAGPNRFGLEHRG